MKTNRFDRFLSWIEILAMGTCVVSLFRMVFHYCLQALHVREEQAHWNRVFPTFVSVFVFSLVLALACLAVHSIRKGKERRHKGGE